MSTGKQIRVLVVDDSDLVRDLIGAILSSEQDILIVGQASNGMDAFDKVMALKPDIVTMDIEMPVLGGLEAIENIMAGYPVPILVVTALTGVRTAFAAVSKGALDVIEKPDISVDNARKLIAKVRKLAKVDIHTHLATMGKKPAAPPGRAALPEASRINYREGVIAVAASTGGPQALYTILANLPKDFPVPILVTQHIAEGFTQGMVDWLAGGTPLQVRVATHGERLLPGRVYVNPAERAMTLVGQSLALGKHPEKTVFHPCCNTMLKSVAHSCAGRTVGCILSGMGSDGVEGMRAIKAAGGFTLAQDATSSMVYGMNKLAVDKGHVDLVLPLTEIAGVLASLVGKA